MSPQPPKIAIIGAGPTGCMLARLLLHLSSTSSSSGIITNPPTIHIYESESSPNYRSQGGTLDLHSKTGLAALQAAGLFDKFLEKARYDGDSLQITDKDLRVYMKLAPSKKPSADPDSSSSSATGSRSADKIGKQVAGARPEIDRGDLRQILAESLPPDTIRWGKHLKRILDSHSPQSTKKYLEFTNGERTPEEYDLIIGADGAFSKTRSSYLSPDQKQQQPIFTRIVLFDILIPSPAKETAPEIYNLINRGNLFAHGTGKFLPIQYIGDGSINLYPQWVLPADQSEQDWMEKCTWFFPDDPERTRHALVDENCGGPFGDWHPLLKEGIVKATGRCTPRMLYQLPVGYRWDHKRGVTLVGDAAHLMTPYAGEGVNLGLMDCLVLAGNIVDALKQAERQGEGKGGLEGLLDEAVRKYELEMWLRSEKVARLTDQLKEFWMFTEGSPGTVIAPATALFASWDAPRLVRPFIKALVHGYFWGRRVIWGY